MYRYDVEFKRKFHSVLNPLKIFFRQKLTILAHHVLSAGLGREMVS
jgi:hypothetical protein